MSELSQMFWTAAITGAVAGALVLVGFIASRFGNGRGERVPASQPEARPEFEAPSAPQEPPILDPLRLAVYVFDRDLRNGPEVSTPGELALLPPFRRLVEHFSRPEFDDEALAS